MARIRSIKPEFWTDESNLSLSDSCALFFIGLWNFCDDEGKHRLGLRQICAELGGRWRKDKVSLYLLCLVQTGQIRISSDVEWLQITGWSHQKIDKPKQSEVKAADLQWLSREDSTKALEQSRGIDARIGEDRRERRGSDDTREQKSRRKASPAVPAAPAPIKSEPDSTAFFIAKYCERWKERHGSSPPITGKDAGIAKRVARGWSNERVEHFLAAYFSMPDAHVAKARHPLELFEFRLKEIAAFADSGQFVTRRQANQADDTASNMILLEKVRRGEA